MELQRVIKILREFNDYRRNRGKFANETTTIKDLQFSPREIGDALDYAITILQSALVENNLKRKSNDSCN